MNDDAEWFRRLFIASAERSQLASEIYGALKSSGQLHRHRLLTYRCPQRCTLLEIVDAGPEGRIIGFPRYKTSRDQTERTSTESGRAKNTEDGYRRWKQHAAFEESVSRPPLSCDHLRSVPLEDDAIAADLAARHAEVVVRPDGSRYAR